MRSETTLSKNKIANSAAHIATIFCGVRGRTELPPGYSHQGPANPVRVVPFQNPDRLLRILLDASYAPAPRCHQSIPATAGSSHRSRSQHVQVSPLQAGSTSDARANRSLY